MTYTSQGTRSHLREVITSRAVIVGAIVFVLYAPVPAALGFHLQSYGLTALLFAVIAWAIVRGSHRVIGFVYFSGLTVGVLAMVSVLFAHTG